MKSTIKDRLLENNATNTENFGRSRDYLDPEVWGTWRNRHRDSDILTNSNFEVLKNNLKELFPEDVKVESYGHWAVGWQEVLRVNTTNEKLLERITWWEDKLEDYPVADDNDYSERQYQDTVDAWCSYGLHDIAAQIENMPSYKYKYILDDDGNIKEEFMETVEECFCRNYAEDSFYWEGFWRDLETELENIGKN